MRLGIRVALSAVAGALVYLSFPPADVWPASYAALAPMLVAALSSPSRKGAALCGAVTGLVAYLPALYWLSSVTVGGWILLAFYLALYVALAAVLARSMHRRHGALWPLLLACAWVGLEIVRAKFCTGFPWLLYGYTQYRVTPLVQLSALTGVYGLSFLLVFLNASLAGFAVGVLARTRSSAPPGVRHALAALIACALILAVLGVGGMAARSVPMKRGPVVGVVQQNIPRIVSEIIKPRTEAEAYARVRAEIVKAARLSDQLDGEIQLLVWPETTVQVPMNVAPELWEDPEFRSLARFAFERLALLAQQKGCRLLVGAGAYLPRDRGYVRVVYDSTVEHSANSAVYFDAQGNYLDRYDKMHLVPFGEYVPLRDWLPFLQVFTPMTRDITPGEDPVIFTLPLADGGEVRFAALVCYEDVVPALVRRFRRRGAQFLVNVTDEGWYRPRGELQQHVAMAVFRAAETRTTVVRAANTGISCFINPRGEVYAVVCGEVEGRLSVRNVEGAIAAPVWTADVLTPYVRFGDWFALLCAVVGLGPVIVRPLRTRVRRLLRRRGDG